MSTRPKPPVVAGRELPFSARAHRTVLLAGVVVVASTVFAASLLPSVGAAGRMAQRFSEHFNAIGGDIDLILPHPPERSTIYAADGTVLANLFFAENRKWVELRRVNRLAQNAVLAIEDSNFYEHPGVDASSILRALLANVTAGEIVQGASTITQQLVRNLIEGVGTERTLVRKIQEARVATRLERDYSKDEILEFYLNEVYFGRGVYGIGTAAQFYFGKTARNLSLPEAALLAGLIAAPERFSPVNDRDAALNRRNVVLDRMLDLEMISEGEAIEAVDSKLKLRRGGCDWTNEGGRNPSSSST